PRRRRRALRARATALRRRHQRRADDDHRVGELVLALQPGVPHPIARILETMTDQLRPWRDGAWSRDYDRPVLPRQTPPPRALHGRGVSASHHGDEAILRKPVVPKRSPTAPKVLRRPLTRVPENTLKLSVEARNPLKSSTRLLLLAPVSGVVPRWLPQ